MHGLCTQGPTMRLSRQVHISPKPYKSIIVAAPCARAFGLRRNQGRNVAVAVQAVRSAADGNDDDGDDDDEGATVAGKALRVERLLANLGYGKRRECQVLVKKGRVTRRDGGKLKVGDKVCWGDVVLDEEDLDPPSPLLLALHKPGGYVVTSPDDENITDPVVYDLLPYRFARRRPFLAPVGRLDKDTSGLLLLTDDGALLHRINSPRRGIWKVYEATLAEPMSTNQAAAAARRFASGSLVLEGDHTPLLPAKLDLIGARTARVAICEGKYHQVRRMFAAVGSHVVALHRVSVGGLTLGSLPEGEWRYLQPQELQLVFEGPSAEDVLGSTATASAATGSMAGGYDATCGVSERDGGATASSSTSSGGGSALFSDQPLSMQGQGQGQGQGERRLTKKEKKKGKKKARGLAGGTAVGGRAGAERDFGGEEDAMGDEEDDEEEEDVADFELLPPLEATARDVHLRDAVEEKGQEYDDEEAGDLDRRSARRRPPRRGPTVRQGTVHDAREGSLDEQLDPATYGIPYDDAAADVVMSAGGSSGGGAIVRKYREGARWRRRRDALRQMLPS
ncbi:pseudouridine synthase mitochondrial precursor [Volvox carteri f. nagariensis]|uniref:Pseudouridine synthase mitochondrial n=1 Tax=Volvox carteri f. nagariensis TaxID=3068 RepID=D8U8R3_VOLCA|nr:pseudouridine synthase mitochondrial precursor [Volvox carteri f. nagariensis]EFJ43850.1 pseudouridine synthase mitochondrial precursor [Volvox carteri f. nagariensis]|eukprot:XP_002955096.1 pseudouridine synthase mitochondrial precursor [Volvox carteri f. nagariensis]